MTNGVWVRYFRDGLLDLALKFERAVHESRESTLPLYYTAAM